MPIRDFIIFLDWGGTLSETKFWNDSPRLLEIAQQKLFSENHDMVRDWMLGKYSSEDMCRWLTESTEQQYEAALHELNKSCANMKIADEATQTIQELKQRARIALATDNMDCFRRFTVPAQHFDQLFDDILDSSSIRRMKTEDSGRTFTDYTKLHSTDLQSCYLIDDSQTTCDLFRSLGGTAYLTKGRENTLEHLATISQAIH